MLKIQQKRDFEYEFYNQIYKLKKNQKKVKRSLKRPFLEKNILGK